MTGVDAEDDMASMSFETAMAELETIVARLEKGEAKLDEAIGDYERGALLRRHCEARLREAREKVEKIRLGADGSIAAEPESVGEE